MRLLVVNPNSTASMTDKIRECAERVAAPGTEIIATNPKNTPASIEGFYDGAISVPAVIEEVRAGDADGFDGFVLACFDDPGLAACREVARGPVLGVAEAAMHAASMIANSFSIVTTLPRSIPIIEELAHQYGMAKHCRKIRAADIPVLALEEENGNARMQIRGEIMRAIVEDHCEAVILGCAGMTDLTDWLSQETGIPVIDGVGVAVKMVEALVGAGLAISKVGGYAAPRVK